MSTHSKLRVLHVGKFYPPASGGMERVVQMLCECVSDEVDSQVLVAHDRARTIVETVNGVRVVRVATWHKVGAVALCPSFPWWWRKLGDDVTVVHVPNPVALVAHAVARPRGRVIVWMHAEVVRPQWRYNAFYRPFMRRMLRLADAIVVSSPAMLEHARELDPYLHKCHVIPFAIDPDQHALSPATPEAVRPLRSRPSEALALFVGRMVPYKGVDVFLRALTKTRGRAVLVGEGPLKSTWQRMATELGLQDRVTFAGEVSAAQLTAFYNACDFLVLPSVTKAEAFGMVQLEAMSCGKPVISTNLPSGVPWVNQHGVTGLVVAPGDEAALADAVNRLDHDADMRAALGAGARQRVVAEFALSRVASQTAALYRHVSGDVQSTPATNTNPRSGTAENRPRRAVS